MQGFISLHSSCRKRLDNQVNCSITQRSFLLKDFVSPDFIDSIFVPLYEKSSLIKSRIKLHSSFDIIDPVKGVSVMAKQQISMPEKHVVQETASNQGNYQSTKEELDLLKVELRRCHRKILSSTSHLVLVDEFSNLLSQYCKSRKQTEKHKGEDILISPKKLETLENSPPNLPIKADNIQSAPQDTIAGSLAIKRILYGHSDKVFKIQNHDYLLSTVVQTSNSNLDTIEIIDCKTHQTLAKSVKIFEKGVEQILTYAASLNMIITRSIRMSLGLILKFYRLSPNGLKRVAEIPFHTFTSNDPSIMRSEFEVELLEPEYLFACFASQTLILVNILTRKVVKTHTYRENVEGIRYIQTLKLLVIICENQLFVYDFDSRLALSEPRFSIKHGRNNILYSGIYSALNVVVICKQRTNPRVKILKHGPVYTFIVFEINLSDVNVYKVTVESFELADRLNDKLAPSGVKIEEIVINPALGEFYVYCKSRSMMPAFVEFSYRSFEMKKYVAYIEPKLLFEKSSVQRKKLKRIIKSFEEGE